MCKNCYRSLKSTVNLQHFGSSDQKQNFFPSSSNERYLRMSVCFSFYSLCVNSVKLSYFFLLNWDDWVCWSIAV